MFRDLFGFFELSHFERVGKLPKNGRNTSLPYLKIRTLYRELVYLSGFSKNSVQKYFGRKDTFSIFISKAGLLSCQLCIQMSVCVQNASFFLL